MKKIFSLIIALMMALSIAGAQTVEHSTFFENTSVTLYGGGITTQHFGGETFFWGGAKNVVKGIRPVAGIEVSKYVTPVVGFGLEGLAMFNTTGSNTIVDQSNLVGNLKLNLSNWFGGYPGEPRRVEVVLVPGLGWGHDYGDVHHNYKNYFTYNVGAEFNVNLDKERSWQFNVKPVAVWNNYNRELGLHKKNLQARVQVGLTYKFGSTSKKSHNFVLCPYTVTASDYDAVKSRVKELENDNVTLQNKVNELESREPEVITKEIKVPVEVNRKPALQTILTFPIGSAKLSPVENAKLGVLGKVIKADEKVYLVGSADSATGSENFNKSLAVDRAEAVKDILVKNYGISADRVYISTALDTNELPEASRAVVITLE